MATKETFKMGHILGASRQAAKETIARIRHMISKDLLDDANELFFGDYQTDLERYMATARDLQKEEIQSSRAQGGSAENLMRNVQGPDTNIMASKGDNILGTSGATKGMMNNLPGNSGGRSYSERGRAEGMSKEGGGEMGGGTVPPSNNMGGGSGAARGGVDLEKLPKLQL